MPSPSLSVLAQLDPADLSLSASWEVRDELRGVVRELLNRFEKHWAQLQTAVSNLALLPRAGRPATPACPPAASGAHRSATAMSFRSATSWPDGASWASPSRCARTWSRTSPPGTCPAAASRSPADRFEIDRRSRCRTRRSRLAAALGDRRGDPGSCRFSIQGRSKVDPVAPLKNGPLWGGSRRLHGRLRNFARGRTL